MQASHFGSAFDQLQRRFPLNFFYEILTESTNCNPRLIYHGAKQSLNDQKLKSRGPALIAFPASVQICNLKQSFPAT